MDLNSAGYMQIYGCYTHVHSYLAMYISQDGQRAMHGHRLELILHNYIICLMQASIHTSIATHAYSLHS